MPYQYCNKSHDNKFYSILFTVFVYLFYRLPLNRLCSVMRASNVLEMLWKWSWHSSRYCYGKPQHRRSRDRDLNPCPPECETEMLPTWQLPLILVLKFKAICAAFKTFFHAGNTTRHQTNFLILFRRVTADYSENHIKCINIKYLVKIKSPLILNFMVDMVLWTDLLHTSI